MEKGKSEGKIEFAFELIKDSTSNERITKYTGLEEAEIEKLRSECAV